MLLFAFIAAAASAATVPQTPAESKICRHTTAQYANDSGLYRGQPLTPRKLTELPPAIGFMAVYRRINGCEAPMTMVEYRGQGRGR